MTGAYVETPVLPGFDERDLWVQDCWTLISNDTVGFSLPRSRVSWSLGLRQSHKSVPSRMPGMMSTWPWPET